MEEVVAHVVEQFDNSFDDETWLGLLAARVVSCEPGKAVSDVVAVRAVVMNVNDRVTTARSSALCKPTQGLLLGIQLAEDGVAISLGQSKDGPTICIDASLVVRVKLRTGADC